MKLPRAITRIFVTGARRVEERKLIELHRDSLGGPVDRDLGLEIGRLESKPSLRHLLAV